MKPFDYTDLNRSQDYSDNHRYDHQIDDLHRRQENLWLTRFCQYIRFPVF